jgi:hypothetical protein
MAPTDLEKKQIEEQKQFKANTEIANGLLKKYELEELIETHQNMLLN